MEPLQAAILAFMLTMASFFHERSHNHGGYIWHGLVGLDLTFLLVVMVEWGYLG